ncbi:3'-5' exonuclease [Marilutibacter spongiae]|uniref:3'-5' exonuclease n=1 Tax=Marilutibacter spongiae TaxID=2025720 RepID=A0A7W3TKG1_9GAMM|nr:3'-5' exonuclease [Lysobacter spongiae]MBB1059982.1 3'-5' exonuclease [Lysobacter spongiae]
MMWPAWRRWRDRRLHGNGPWAALLAAPPARQWVSLDLETSGLDPGRDRILSIAAVPIVEDRVCLSQRFEAIVRPAVDAAPPDLDALRHHRLRPQDLAGGLALHDAVAGLLDWLGPRPLVGYRIGFDVAMLDRVVPGITGFALPNRRIDIAARYRARHRHRAPDAAIDETGFEALAAVLGVPQLGRHTALGDATTAALCWLALQAGR